MSTQEQFAAAHNGNVKKPRREVKFDMATLEPNQTMLPELAEGQSFYHAILTNRMGSLSHIRLVVDTPAERVEHLYDGLNGITGPRLVAELDAHGIRKILPNGHQAMRAAVLNAGDYI